MMRKLLMLAVAAVATLAFTQFADAAPPAQIFTGHGDIDCATQGSAPYTGQTWCGTGISSAGDVSTSPGVEGVPIDLNVALPAVGDGPYPVVLDLHGYGQRKFDFVDPTMQHWLDKGYAVYTQSDRGFGYTCRDNSGDPGCQKGYAHLMDFRYEVRDAQNMLGILADEGIIEPTKIAATGNSYGAGMSMSLAALKDRVMNLDGSLHPWKSPAGTNMKIAVAAPLAPWTDLNYALAPNGNALDYIRNAGYYGPTGVMKESYVQGLITQARNAPAGSDPRADIQGWSALLEAGEPYDSNLAVAAMRTEIGTYHSSYGLPPTEAPAPLFIISGFTDDVFPVDEATRFYNRTQALFPNAPIGLFFGSLGHPRGQLQTNVFTDLATATDNWVDYYLKGEGSKPATNVTTYTQTCPNEDTPGGGPYNAPDWASIAPGEIRVLGGSKAKTVKPDGGSFDVSAVFNPLASLLPSLPPLAGTACATASGAKEPGSANYETDPAPATGYTVMGAPTVIAEISQPGDTSQIAARLVDLSPDGSTETLVARGLWRSASNGFQVFQLHANGWKVEQGHVLRLELLPRDSGQAAPNGILNNYARPSNDQQKAIVSFVDLRIPVLESPGALNGLVKAPAPWVLPDRPGVKLAKGNESIGSISIANYARRSNVGRLKLVARPTVRGKKMRVSLLCPAKFSSCAKATLAVRAKGSVRGFRKPLLAKGSGLRVAPGETRRTSLKLTSVARKIFRGRKTRSHGRKKVQNGAKKVHASITINGKKAGVKTVKRVGKVR